MSNGWSRPFCLRVTFQVRAKSLQAPVVMVTHVRELLISSPRDFLEIQTFEKEHLNRLPLRVWKRRECFGGKPASLLQLEPAWRPKACCFINGTYISLVVYLSDQQIVPPIRAAAICVLKKPHFKSSSRRVELSRFSINLQEDGLREILRFRSIS